MKCLGPIAVFLALLTLLYYGAGFFRPRAATISHEELVHKALEVGAPGSDMPEKRERAAVELSKGGKSARPHVLELLKASRQPEVRVACIRSLAENWDYHSMPMLLDLLDDPAESVRDQASQAVIHLLNADYGFQASDTPAERAESVRQLRATWEEFKRSKRHLAYIRQQMGEDFNASQESKP